MTDRLKDAMAAVDAAANPKMAPPALPKGYHFNDFILTRPDDTTDRFKSYFDARQAAEAEVEINGILAGTDLRCCFIPFRREPYGILHGSLVVEAYLDRAVATDRAHQLAKVYTSGDRHHEGKVQAVGGEQLKLTVPTRADHPTHSQLSRVLDLAFEQSATGKGQERHGDGRDFMRQPIMEIARMTGVGYQTGQVMKKAQEATRMAGNGRAEAARAELLGVIVYAAAAYLLVEETELSS